MKKMLIVWAVWLATMLACSATDYSATIRELSPWITNQLQATGAASLALVLVDGTQAVWTAGFGKSDPANATPADADTIYRICSVSKTFTTLTAMREVDRGRLNLDLPVTNYAPNFRLLDRFPGTAPITPRMLLNHQSGLPGNFVPYGDATAQDLRFAEMMLANFADDVPAFPPGFTDTYCNNGFTVMDSVLAAVSGTGYRDLVTSSLLTPLGMTNTTFLYDTNRFNGRLARSMSGTNVYPDEVVNVFASGGLYSSANDMARLVELLVSGGEFRGVRLLSTNALEAMYTWQATNVAILGETPNTRNGLGLDNVAEPSLAYAGRACWKSGDSACFHAMLEVMPERGLGVAVLCNGGALAVDTAHRVLMYALRDKFEFPVPTNAVPFPDSPAVQDPPLPWAQLNGFYGHSAGYLSVTSDNRSLTFALTVPDQTSYVYSNQAPHSNGWFWAPGATDMQVAFTNVQGRLCALMRTPGTWAWNTTLAGEKVAPTAIADAWRARSLTQWVPADTWASSFEWATDTVTKRSLLVTNGLLVFKHLFLPTNDTLAYPPIAGQNNDGALKVVATNGEEWLRLSGVHYRPLNTLPALAAPGAVAATLTGDITGWHRVPRTGSGTLELKVGSSNVFETHVLNEEFHQLTTRKPWSGRLLVNVTGAVYVAVTRGATAGGNYVLRALWRRTAGDYDGDGKADPAVYGSAQALWGVSYSASGHAQYASLIVGQPNEMTAAEDYDGDGKMDPAVYRTADGLWSVARSGNGYAITTLPGFGAANAIPVPADYDGDGKADPAIYRAADGAWGFQLSAANYATTVINGFGGPDWTAAPADYDGDGKTDPAIYRAGDGVWIIGLSGNSYATATIGGFGTANAIPVSADYDGDGKADPAVYRAPDGTWGFQLSASGYTTTLIYGFGGPDCMPVLADYDGDGKADPTCYRQADGRWGCLLSGSNYSVRTLTFGGPAYQAAR